MLKYNVALDHPDAMTLPESLHVDPDISRAWTLPAQFYFDPEIAAREHTKIFSRTWQVVGHRDQVVETGDYFTTTQLLGEPLLIARGSDDRLRGFYNVCRHRAGPAAEGCGSRKLFRFVYHGWTYNLDGSLNHATEIEGVGGFRPEDFALAPVRCEEWFNLMFVNLDRCARPLLQSLVDLPQQGERFPFSSMKLFERRTYAMKCNWKTYIDNYLEGYHLPTVHPNLNRELDFNSYTVEPYANHVRQSSPIRGAQPGDTTPRRYQEVRDDLTTDYFWAFPNWMLNCYPDNVSLNIILPLDPERTLAIFEFYLPEKDLGTEAAKESVRFSEEVQQEDIAICEAVQKNLHSRSYQRGRFSAKQEKGVHAFHCMYAKAQTPSSEQPVEGSARFSVKEKESLKTKLVVIAICVLLACSAPAQTPDPVDQYIYDEMQKRQIPGLALLVVRDGQIVKAQGYGYSNVELQVPVKPETVFQSGSVGKQFTATAVMMLVEEGKLSLDDPLTKFFSDAPPAWKNVKVRQLLSHTGGFTDYPKGFDFRHDYSEDEMLKIVEGIALAYPPGSKWSYSNLGYLTLGILIHRVTGQFYGDFLHDRIFQPLGMNTRIISEADIIPNRAAGYRLVRGQLKNQEWVSPVLNTTADGSLYFTILDLAKWDAALNTEKLLKRSSLDLMWTPMKLNNGKPNPDGYGFAWFIQDIRGHRIIEHEGAWQGFNTNISRYVDDKLTVVVLANLDGAHPDDLTHHVAGLYIPELTPMPTKPGEGK